MKLTPLEIRKQEFKRTMRGYDSVEVETFLELVAEEYDKALQENTELNKKVITAEAELKHFKEVEKTLKQTLYNVQESSQQSKENSQKEADLIKKEAQLAASQMIDQAKADVLKMQEEVKSLKRQKDSFIARLRHVISSQMELLDVLELDEEQINDLRDRTKKTFTAHKKAHNSIKSDPETIKKSEQKVDKKAPPDKDDTFNNDLFKDIFGDNLDAGNILK